MFMLRGTGTNELRCVDNTRDFLEPGSGGKAVAKWDTTCPSQLRVGCDVTKAGNAARPWGRQPEGVRNAKKDPQNKHSHRRQQTLIATALCALLNYWPQSFMKLITL